jgi:hypothetical protein
MDSRFQKTGRKKKERSWKQDPQGHGRGNRFYGKRNKQKNNDHKKNGSQQEIIPPQIDKVLKHIIVISDDDKIVFLSPKTYKRQEVTFVPVPLLIGTVNVPAVLKPLARQSERFCNPNKEMRNISRAGKLCRSFGVGMFPSEAGARSGMAKPSEAEGPQGPEAHTDLLDDVGAFTQ